MLSFSPKVKSQSVGVRVCVHVCILYVCVCANTGCTDEKDSMEPPLHSDMEKSGVGVDKGER